LARANSRLERSILCLVAFIVFSGGLPVGGPQSVAAWIAAVPGQVQEAVLFPVQLAVAIHTIGIVGLFKAAYQWLQISGGNLFKLSPILAKFFFIGTVVNAMLAWFKLKAPPEAPIRRPLTDAERSIFRHAVLLAVGMLICGGVVVLKESVEYPVWMILPFFCCIPGFFVVYFYLVGTLFESSNSR
jgi:hypothetical protein